MLLYVWLAWDEKKKKGGGKNLLARALSGLASSVDSRSIQLMPLYVWMRCDAATPCLFFKSIKWSSTTCVTWLVHMCDMKGSYVIWLIHMCDRTRSYVWHNLLICVTQPTHVCDVTHSWVWNDPFICVTRLVHACDMTRSYVWHESCICGTWLIHMCDTTHSYMCNTTHPQCTALPAIYPRTIQMCDTTHSYMCNTTYPLCTTISAIHPRTMLHINELLLMLHNELHVWHDSFIYA